MRVTLRALVVVVVALLVVGGTGAAAASLITGKDIKDESVTGNDVKNSSLTGKDVKNKSLTKADFNGSVEGARGPQGPQGDQGPQGPQGPQGAPGKPAQTVVTSLTGAFDATNASVSLTPDGVEFGPYAAGGSQGGSLYYSGLNGKPLSAVKNLVYYARYVSEGNTSGVGVPYLRIFTEGDHDAVFSPNTQPPDSDVDEGPFHEWVATSGLWRYDDDAGAGGEYGLNGAPFSKVVADHGTETISGIYITTGFSAGTDLAALLRWMEVNGETFAFRGK